MLSYWEKKHFIKYDFIIVGAGITGLSTAIELAEKYPKQKILVLERGTLPTGASTRNAGFACMGSLSELMADIEHGSEAQCLDLVEARMQGLSLLRARLGDERLRFKMEGGYELIQARELGLLSKVDYLNYLLYPLKHQRFFSYQPNTVRQLGFNREHICAVITNHQEGSLDPGLMMKNLARLCSLRGVEIKYGMQVTKFEEDSQQVTVHGRALLAAPFYFEAAHLIVCTNGFASELLKDAEVKPGRGQVLLTHPIRGLHLKGIYHMDQGYYYFREIDGRILFGGGRNLDFEGETTTEFGLNARIQQDLEDKLRNWLLPDHPFTIDQRWSGIMGFGKTKKPFCGSLSPRVHAAYAFGGMGVALGSKVAKDLAAIL